MNRQPKRRQSNFFEVCTKCKTSYSCCYDTTPPVTFERRKIIEAYLKEKRISIDNPFQSAGYVFPRLMSDGYCVFHDKKTRKCMIHPVKPETCVAGPITFDVDAQAGKIEWFVKMEKICQLAKVVYEDKGLLKKHLESAKQEIRRLVTQLNVQELRVVLKKDEPETFKIGEEALEKRAAS